MAVHLAKEIQECREHATHCARKAEIALDAEIRDDFLRLEKSWLQLARSYEFAQQLVKAPNDSPELGEKAVPPGLYS